ncbi:MAG: caspase family protein [Bacteroidota bacterium]
MPATPNRLLARTTSCLITCQFTGTLILVFSFINLFSLDAQCLEGNCYDGDGTFSYEDGRRYVGPFRAGQPVGEGTLFYANGERFLGQFLDGVPHGAGVYWYPDGSYRQGQWQAGQLIGVAAQAAHLQARGTQQAGCVSGDCNEGQGTYLTPGGAIYTGQFRNGFIHGQGICTYPDGSRYEGQWQQRYPHGYGTKTWANGTQFTGQWRRGQPMDSNGIFVDARRPQSMLMQAGCIAGDCLNGQGTYAYVDGSRYSGQFLEGRPHGQGEFTYPNGDRHQGRFAFGLPHGQGTRTNADGEVKTGNWIEGGLQVKNNQFAGQGCLSGNCQSGYGTYRFRQGDRYEGTFLAGVPDGNGIVHYQNGDRYEGQMAKGAFEGYGTYYELSGGIYQGRWRNGEYQGNTRVANTPEPVATPPNVERETKVWALIVGVGAYQHMPVLRFPDDDAYRLYAFLQSPPGGAIPDERIRILVDEDATRQNIQVAMRDLFLRAGPKDLVILYFSGHGLPGAFLPIDYNGHQNSLTHQEIKQMLDQSPAGYKLCLADACHSGGLLAARGSALPDVLSRYYDNLASARPGTALIMSSKAEETSLESSGLRQGVFSHYLLRGLKGEADLDRDDVVRVDELFDYISRQTKAYTSNRQSPVIEGTYDRRMPVAVLE